MRKKTLSRHIVADPEICHGQPTFLGTRIRVAQVLEQVAEGMDWDTIVCQWRGPPSRGSTSGAGPPASAAVEGKKQAPSRKYRKARPFSTERLPRTSTRS